MRVAVILVSALTIVLLKLPAGHAGKPKPHHSHRFLVARQVQRGLVGTPLHGLGFVFEAEAWKAGLSPFALVGASGTESSLGAAACRANPRNIWGLGSCDRAWRVPYFATWPQAVRYYAAFIREHWPHARTVYELYGYCECGSAYWGGKTSAWMSRLFGDSSGSLLYPRAVG